LLKGQDVDCVAGARQDEQVEIFIFPGGGGKDEPGLIRFRAQSPEFLKFDVIKIGDWREWIEHNFDFEAIVNRAYRYIETVSPDRPLRLVGYSQGGQVAVATALALKKAGRLVSFVGLIDSGAQPIHQERSVLKFTSAVLKKHLGPYVSARIRGSRDVYYRGYLRVLILHLLWGILHSALRRKVLSATARHIGVLFRPRSAVRLEQFIRMRLFLEMWEGWVLRNRVTQPLDVPVVLFRSQKLDDDLGWKPFCSDLTVVPVSGDHSTIFDEHLDELIAKFTTAVAEKKSIVH
jgi:thioesterase domain-containing protein